MIGRRGPVQAAFTPAEVRELLHLPKVDAVMRASDLELDDHSKEELSKASRNTKLNMKILQQIHDQGDRGNPRKLHLCFLISLRSGLRASISCHVSDAIYSFRFTASLVVKKVLAAVQNVLHVC